MHVIESNIAHALGACREFSRALDTPCVQAKDAVVSEVWGRGVHVLQLDLANEFPRNLW